MYQPAALKRLIDDLARGAYHLMVMGYKPSSAFVLFAVWAVGCAGVFADDLDTALAAQKKKAQRRIYSESALLEEQNLEVPKAPTSEEQALDKQLRDMEAQLDAEAAASPSQIMPPRQAVVPTVPAENKNWLTPAVLDETASLAITNDAESSWIASELDRQKELRTQTEAAAQEKVLVDQMLREKVPQAPSSALDKIQGYKPSSPPLLGVQTPVAPTYMTPQSGVPNPLATLQSTKKKPSNTPSLFSTESARSTSVVTKEPFESIRSPAFNSRLGSAAPKTRADFSSDWNEPVNQPLSPLESIRQSSPIHRDDPFSDDFMPKIKSSIWE